MGIIGQRPDSGLRIEVRRNDAIAAPWVYEGRVATPDADLAVTATLDADGNGTVHVEGSGPGPTDLAEKVRLILKTAIKHAAAEGAAPPRKIVRWRGEK